MGRYLLRTSVGILTFVIGILTVWLCLVEMMPYNSLIHSTLVSETALQTEKITGEIKIEFKGFIKEKDTYFAEFIVRNKTQESIYYGAYEANENDLIQFPIFEVMINNKRFNQMWCGTGLNYYEIKSGEVKHFRSSIWGFAYDSKLKKLRNIKIGFTFTNSIKDNFKTYWTDSFDIPKEIRDEVLKNSK